MTTNCDDNTALTPPGPGMPPPPAHPEPPPPPAQNRQTAYGWPELCADIGAMGGLRPQILDGLFMNMLADHFADPSHIWDDDLKNLIWTPNPATTKLSIFPVTKVDRNTTLDAPAIIVKPQAFKSTRVAIGDVDEEGVAGVTYTRRIDGGHTFIASGGSGLLAKALGWELYSFFESVAPILRNQLGMDLIPSGVGELSSIGDLGNKIAVPVEVAYIYLSTVAVRTIDPDIKVFSHDLNLTP